MPTHAEDSLRKIFDSKYAASQSPWTILTNANILGQNKHTIITRQAVVPSCFSQVTHAKVDERQTFSLYKSTFASDMHWFSSVDDITPMPGHGLTTKKTGFLASCMGHSTKIEDASTKLCCRDERDVGYTILALDSAGMTFAGELAMSSFYDCHIQAEDIFNAQPTGDESAFPVHFTCTLEPKGVAGLMPGDKVIKMHDMCSLMFLDNCFVMYRAMLNMHRQDNPIMKGCFWQVSIGFSCFICYLSGKSLVLTRRLEPSTCTWHTTP